MPNSIFKDLKLKPLVQAFVENRAGYYELRSLINVCQKMAKAYIHSKINARRLDIKRFGITSDELAYEAIAELFRMDEADSFIEIKNYFNKLIASESVDEDEMIIQLRRLIFSIVNHYLFRLNKAHDPDLAKIIRNLKDTVKNKTSFELMKVYNQRIINFAPHEKNTHLPFIPEEYLAMHLNGSISPKNIFETFLLEVEEIFSAQTEFRKEYPLIDLAYLLRNYLANRNIQYDSSEINDLDVSELKELLAESQSIIKNAVGSKYISKGKITRELFDVYLKTVYEILSSEYITENETDLNYYQILSKHIPKLTPEDYKVQHRTKLEYFVSLNRKNFLKLAQKELLFSAKSSLRNE